MLTHWRVCVFVYMCVRTGMRMSVYTCALPCVLCMCAGIGIVCVCVCAHVCVQSHAHMSVHVYICGLVAGCAYNGVCGCVLLGKNLCLTST